MMKRVFNKPLAMNSPSFLSQLSLRQALIIGCVILQLAGCGSRAPKLENGGNATSREVPSAEAAEQRPTSAEIEYLSGNNIKANTFYSSTFQGDVAVYMAGEPTKPAVLLIHGIGEGGAVDWKTVLPALRNYYVVALDLPGFGRSVKGNQLYTPAKYQLLLEQVVQRYLNNRRFALIGHSMGATLAMQYAASRPSAIEKLVLIDAAGILRNTELTGFLSRMGVPDYWKLGQEKYKSRVGRYVGQFLSRTELFAAPPIGRVLRSETLRQTLLGGQPAAISALALGAHNFSDSIFAVASKTLIIWGEQDSVAPLRSGFMLSGAIEGAELLLLPDTGHVPMKERPGAVSNAIQGFLAGQEVGTVTSWDMANRSRPAAPRDYHCNGQRYIALQGRYRHIHLNSCEDAVLDSVIAESIVVRNSANVEIRRSRVVNLASTAVDAEQSDLRLTGSFISGGVGISSSQSEWNIYGSTIVGHNDAVVARSNENLFTFSVSRAGLQGDLEFRHDVLKLHQGQRL